MARILSCFHDETGEQDMRASYYMVAMVIHDQDDTPLYGNTINAVVLADDPA